MNGVGSVGSVVLVLLCLVVLSRLIVHSHGKIDGCDRSVI